jgi:hypothetical protein
MSSANPVGLHSIDNAHGSHGINIDSEIEREREWNSFNEARLTMQQCVTWLCVTDVLVRVITPSAYTFVVGKACLKVVTSIEDYKLFGHAWYASECPFATRADKLHFWQAVLYVVVFRIMLLGFIHLEILHTSVIWCLARVRMTSISIIFKIRMMCLCIGAFCMAACCSAVENRPATLTTRGRAGTVSPPGNSAAERVDSGQSGNAGLHPIEPHRLSGRFLERSLDGLDEHVVPPRASSRAATVCRILLSAHVDSQYRRVVIVLFATLLHVILEIACPAAVLAGVALRREALWLVDTRQWFTVVWAFPCLLTIAFSGELREPLATHLNGLASEHTLNVRTPPNVKRESAKMTMSDAGLPTYEICPICITELESTLPVHQCERCLHEVHSDCLTPWVALHGNCPMCRFEWK